MSYARVCSSAFTFSLKFLTVIDLSSVYNMRNKIGLRNKSKKLTNHSQLFFLYLTVID